MPTGYTADIVDGKLTTFEEFAKLSIRAMGVAVHMRDEPLDNEFRPRIPSSYYYNSIGDAKARLEVLIKMDDETLLATEVDTLKSSIEYYTKSIVDKIEVRKRLDRILKDATEWVPPTLEHREFKSFMISQLKNTIEFDCDVEYDKNRIAELTDSLKSLESADVKTIREKRLEELNDDVISAQERYELEVDRCDAANEWANQLLNSLK